MTTVLAVAAIMFLLAVLVSLSRSGSADLLGGAPFGSDALDVHSPGESDHDTDARRARADLAAVAAHGSH